MSPREHVDSILRAALAAVEGGEAVRRALRLEGESLRVADSATVDLAGVRSLWIVGAGKAAPPMARAALEVLGERVAGGTVTTRHGSALPLPGIEVWEAGHPLPDGTGLAGAAEALRLARRAGEGDLLLCLLSGGASALWPAPPDGVTLGDLRDLTVALLRSGAPIEELNAVRRHLSHLAGGGLARAAAPARVVTLAISDVVGAPPHAIGSGPTVPDPTTYADALRILTERGVQAPSAALRHLQAGASGDLPETVKPEELEGTPDFHVVAWIGDALYAAAAEAERLGYRARVVTDHLEGEAREAGAEIARAALAARDAGEGPVALLWGGETTVTVRGAGSGGRNQELALAAALALEGEAGITVAAFGTDGVDGTTPAAGAAVDGGTAARGREEGLDPLEALSANDSHPFLRAAGDLLVTGPTGTNVGDVVVALVE